MPVAVPEELTVQTAEGNTVLFVGAGMSQPRLPGWRDLLSEMLDWAVSQSISLGGEEEAIRDLIGRGKLPLAAQLLRERLGEGDFCRFLRRVFRDPSLQPGPVHRLLPQMGFASILTTNFDKLIEFAFPAGTPCYTPRDYAELAGVLRGSGPAIVKVHGDIDRCDSIVLGQADYRTAMFANESFRKFLTALFMTRSVLFVGCSLTDPDLLLFLDELEFQLHGHFGPHFALMRTFGMNLYERGDYQKRYGIRILGDDAWDDFPDIHRFLRDLKAAVSGRRPSARVAEPVPEAEALDTRGLLEAMGHRIVKQEPLGDCVYFLGEYKAGAQIRRALTCYVPRAPRLEDLKTLYDAEEGILLAREPIPEEIAQAARARGIQAYGREEFVGHLANFQPYLAKLGADYEGSKIEPYFVPLRIREERAGQPLGDPIPLDDFMERWLAAPERNHLSLLGDFGTGKTWFCRRLAWQMAARVGRIPIAVALRDYSRAYDIEQVLTDALANRFGVELAAGFKTVQRLNDEGRLLLIFDGFDEMERRASDYRTAVENFWQIARLISPRAKILLTCRNAFFRHRTEEEEVLEARSGQVRIVRGDDIIDLAGRREFEVVHLTEFDDAQIRLALQKLVPDDWERVFERIRALPNIEDLAHRPVLLGMIAETLPAIARTEDLNLATLYEHYTGALLRARVETIPAEERLYFVQELAWEMQRTNRLSIPFSEFPARVTEHFRLKDHPEQAAFFDRDIRTQSYLVRDDAGNYRFAHKSMMEYFVARKLAPLLAEGKAPQCPLTDAIVSFVHHLVAPSYRYERRCEDDMVYVPAGQFILGAEREGNLRVATVEHDFWIDRYPVTSEQFCRFLNEQGKGDAAEWLDPKWGRIEKRGRGFSVEAGYERHPAVGVSWHGAVAYAASLGQRLPTEQEWEKAARGIDGRRYPWGEEFCKERCNTWESEDIRDTTPVGRYGEAGSSPYGCEEMAGNVWEWTDSLYQEGQVWRVRRGGAWGSGRDFAACSSRAGAHPLGRVRGFGFRCARTVH